MSDPTGLDGCRIGDGEGSPYHLWRGRHCGPPSEPHRYLLTSLLSVTGSEGVLFTAIDGHAPAPRRHIALKIARPGLSRQELDRIWRRWSQAAAARIHHDGLVRIDEPFLGPVPGSMEARGPTLLYLPMELVDGIPLDQLADTGTYGIGLLAALRLPAAALDYLAAKGLTHLDFKPGNIIVRPDGSGVVVDLGTLRASDAAPTIFTLGFVAPEVLAAAPWTDQSLSRADAYSFAATVSWALTGAQPLRLPDDAEWTDRLLRLLPNSPTLRAVLLRGLSCDPARRPTSLLRWLDEVVGAAVLPAADRAPRRGNAARSLTAAAVACAIAGAGAWLLVPPSHPSATAALASGAAVGSAVVADTPDPPAIRQAPNHRHHTSRGSRTERTSHETTPAARVVTVSAPQDVQLDTKKPGRSPSRHKPSSPPDPRPSPTAPSAVTVALPAASGSMPTGLTVRSGQPIEISATGRASYGYQGATPDNDLSGMSDVDPDGNLLLDGAPNARKFDAFALLPTAPVGALIARVESGPWFLVGSTWSGNAPADGTIRLAFNDIPGGYGDNSGTYQVALHILPSS